MTTHLSDEQMTAMLLGSPDGNAAAHLAECEACWKERQELGQAVDSYGRAMRAAADRLDPILDRQARAIGQRVASENRRGSLRLAWAGSLALLAMAATLVMSAPAPQAMDSFDPDHDLLVGVERAVGRDVPRALEPATLLAHEIQQSVNSASQSKSQ